MTQLELAEKMDVPIQRVNGIINGRRSITAETAILLGRVLKTTPEFWMNLQQAYELRTAELESGAALRAIKPMKRAG